MVTQVGEVLDAFTMRQTSRHSLTLSFDQLFLNTTNEKKEADTESVIFKESPKEPL